MISYKEEVLFVVDLNGSTKGRTIEAIAKMDQKDSFSILEFNDQTYLYSSTL